MLYHGSFLPFMKRPITLMFLVLTVGMLVWGFFGDIIKRKIQKEG